MDFGPCFRKYTLHHAEMTVAGQGQTLEWFQKCAPYFQPSLGLQFLI